METAKMNATLALLAPDEIDDALRFVEICEPGGGGSEPLHRPGQQPPIA